MLYKIEFMILKFFYINLLHLIMQGKKLYMDSPSGCRMD